MGYPCLEEKGKPWAQKEISGQRAAQCGDTHVKHPGSRHRCYSSYPIRSARRAAGPHDEHKPHAVGAGHGTRCCAWLLGAASGAREAPAVPVGRNLPLAPRSPRGNRAARRLLPQAAALCRRRGRILRPAVRLGAGGRRSAGLVVVALLIRFLKRRCWAVGLPPVTSSPGGTALSRHAVPWGVGARSLPGASCPDTAPQGCELWTT